VQVIELRKQIRHLVALGHVPSDLCAARVVVDMAVGIDDLHDPNSFATGNPAPALRSECTVFAPRFAIFSRLLLC
jgi:hypothetical protein